MALKRYHEDEEERKGEAYLAVGAAVGNLVRHVKE